jgi:hypothetical protein
MVHHGVDRSNGEPIADRLAHVDEEDGKTFRFLFHLVEGRRAREQKHQVGMLGARRPDFLAPHDVVVAVAAGGGAQRRRVGAGGRLGDAERLQPQPARGDLREVAALLFVGAVPQHRAHRVHLGMAGGAVAPGALHLLEDRRRRRKAQARAAVFLRDQD